jgi:putative hemolysin
LLASSPSELDRVYSFRYQVFVCEQVERIGHADHARRMLIDPSDAHASHLTVVDGDDVLIGAIRTVFGCERASSEMRRNYSLDRFARWESEKFSFAGRLFVLPEGIRRS